MTPRPAKNLLFSLLSLAAATPLTAAPLKLDFSSSSPSFGNVPNTPVIGTYLNDLDAAMHGVHLGEQYIAPGAALDINDTVPLVRTVAIWGDSQAEITSTSRYSAFLPAARLDPQEPPIPIQYGLLPGVTHPERYAVVQLNPGGTGPLSVSLAGTLLTVTLGRQDGVPVSTLQEIRDAVAQACGQTFAVILEGGSRLTDIAQVQTQPVYLAPAASYEARSPFTWLQTLTGQAFNFARRPASAADLVPGAPHFGKTGDWDYGYDQATAQDLAAFPGPTSDILASQADLIIGSAGAYDLIQGFTPEQTRDHIVALWTVLQASNRTFAWMAIPPFGDAARQATVAQTNQLLLQEGQARRVLVLNWEPYLVNGQANPGGVSFLDGGPVPSSFAAYDQAVALKPLFTQLLAPAPRFDLTPTSWITANPILETAPRTHIALGWQPDASGRIHPDVAFPSSVGHSEFWQQIRVDPLPAGTVDPGATYSTIPSTSNWAEGDLVEGVARIEMIGGTRFQDLSIQVIFHGTDGVLSTMAVADPTPAAFPGSLPGYINPDLLLRTPACAVPHGTTGISLQLTVRGGATFQMRNAGVRRALSVQDSATAIPVSLPGGPALTLAPFGGGTVASHYTGSIYAYEGDATDPTPRARGGFDSFTMAKDGTFSARGRIDGVAFSIKGKLDSSGAGNFTIPLPAALTHGAPASLSLYRVLSTEDSTFRIVGTLTGVNGDRPLSIDLVQAGFAAPDYPYPAGLYTAIIPALPGEFPAGEPQGNGVATLAVKADGTLRCQYVLADGTVGTRSGKLGGNSVWQFYFPASGSAAAQGGLLSGHLQFHPASPGITAAANLDGAISWKVPANAKSPLFPAGFDTQRTIAGWKYEIPGKSQPTLPNLTGTRANASYFFNNSVRSNVDWSPADTVKAPGLSARANRNTGLITGTGLDPVSQAKIKLYAVVLQNEDPAAYGFFLNTATKPPAAGTTTNGEVRFKAPSIGTVTTTGDNR